MISRREEQHFFDYGIERKDDKQARFWLKYAMGRVWLQADK
jgi:hypothetical protein